MNNIRTERLILKIVTRKNIYDVFNIYSSPEVCKYYDIEPFTELIQAEKHVERWLKYKDEGKQIRYTINLEDKCIGTCGLYLINQYHKRASLGYDLLPSYWRKGFATEAIPSMLNRTVQDYNLSRIQAEVLPENLVSQSFLEKNGFTREGLLSKYENWGQKGFVDIIMFSRIFR